MVKKKTSSKKGKKRGTKFRTCLLSFSTFVFKIGTSTPLSSFQIDSLFPLGCAKIHPYILLLYRFSLVRFFSLSLSLSFELFIFEDKTF